MLHPEKNQRIYNNTVFRMAVKDYAEFLKTTRVDLVDEFLPVVTSITQLHNFTDADMEDLP